MADGYQQFYKYRRDATSTGYKFLDMFPCESSLGVDADGVSPLLFNPGDTPGNRILATKLYDDTFHHLLEDVVRDAPKGQCLLGSLAEAHMFSKKSHFPKFHAGVANFSWLGTLV